MRNHKGLRIDAKDPVLTLVPHPVAADPVPIPRSHISGRNRQTAALLALQQTRRGGFEFSGTGSHPFFQFGIEALQLSGFAVQLGENLDLGAKHLRDHRNRYVIDGTHGVTAKVVDIGHLDGRDEDHGGLLKPRVITDHGGKLEAVELRHANVEQDHGNVVLEQAFKRFPARRGHQQVFPELPQDDFIGKQFGRLIVDQEYIDLVIQPHHSLIHPSDAATFATPAAAARC
jgi:hypothetical protein